MKYLSTNSKHILVTGPHRSGTTWIGNTIAEHGGMRLLLEPFNKNFPPYGFGVQLNRSYADFDSSDQQEELKRAFDAVLASGAAGYALGVCRATQAGLKTPLRFAWHFLQAAKNPRVLVKDPLALFSAGWLYERYGMDVICTIRSPWAFVASLKVAKWGFSFHNLSEQEGLMKKLPEEIVSHMFHLMKNSDDKIAKWCHLWTILHHQIRTYRQQYTHWQFVRYEDVAGDPLRGFTTMLEGLGLSMTPQVKTYIENYTSAKSNQGPSTSYKPRDSRKAIDSWKERLTEDEIKQITDLTGELAQVFYPEMLES